MSMLLDTMRPMIKKKTIEIFLLANNYSSIEGSSIGDGNKIPLLEALKKQWLKHEQKLEDNGWDRVFVTYINEDTAEIIAWRLLNKHDHNICR